MKNRFFRILTAVILVAVIILLPIMPTSAANEDFEVSFVFRNDVVGYLGGYISLEVTVRNTGPTEINYVDTVINTTTPFNERYLTTIAPGGIDVWYYDVRFRPEDLNKELTILFSMNNDAFPANPDGMQIEKFEMGKLDEIVRVSSNISPSKSIYNYGETVEITYEYENVAPMSIENCLSYVLIYGHTDSSGALLLENTEIRGVLLLPGRTEVHDVTLELSEDADGGFAVQYTFNFDYQGISYTVADVLYRKSVVAKPIEIEFEALLGADPLSISAGQEIDFEVSISNTGVDAIEAFIIKDEEGTLVSELAGLSPGESNSTSIQKVFDETTTLYYNVIGRNGDTQAEVATNPITITVLLPEVSPSDDPTGTPDTVSEPDNTLEPGQTEELLVEPEQTSGLPSYLYIVFAVVGLSILAALILLTIYLAKKKMSKR